MPKQLLISLLCLSVLAMSGCGFALRGTHSTLQVAPHHANVQLFLDDNATAFALKRPLTEQLSLLGITSQSSANDHIQIKNLRFRRYELVGTLTEVRLVLMAEVSYTLTQDHQTTTKSTAIQVERSYQYNEASVATTDSQGEQVKGWLYDALASRIAEQYRTLASSPTSTTPK